MIMFNECRDVNACDKFGYTALHYAARSGKDEICQLLLDRKAAVNACAGECEATPLHRACIGGHISVRFVFDEAAAIDIQLLCRKSSSATTWRMFDSWTDSQAAGEQWRQLGASGHRWRDVFA